MSLGVDTRVEGAKKLQQKMEQIARDLHGDGMIKGVKAATLLVQGDAKRNLVGYVDPATGGVDTGDLRASIVPEIRTPGDEIQGVVGSKRLHAPFVEFDTRPHMPPLKKLEVWARRHGTSAYVVALAIRRRGTKGKKYLTKALESNSGKIKALLGKTVGAIVKK